MANMPAMFPTGVPTRSLQFGRYWNALGVSKSGQLTFTIVDPILHVPTNTQLVAGNERVMVPKHGMVEVAVPVTEDPDFVSKWDEPTDSYLRQPILLTVNIRGIDVVTYAVSVPVGAEAIEFDPTGYPIVEW